ncbi:Glycosyltransferase involved in cell wall bisynthesis [Actinopolymorpha cephalotaxi]|uniref:Glycosyltransferase involved in cell wall biosynthesis n=1 Tax=Actinopolymorpha cephalotaxi TaxID=504797 RepID=A0A1I2R5B9_9ACTN|nr:glycosyltransferase [Actinopolymorpha cephalotaxi]NYH82383.1 glycosyltransferase involved in cell wall biosynthesis [Actinopolymorpha cephalotaxi]SFG34679.1 Glycosyltransferase involved in cell wall bisynthesis [Actinopolymorpha cephalotaxi]
MAEQLKVSVVVPVYNPGRYVEDCIASLLRQSLPAEEFEAIFVDDGSTDETPARLDALAAEHPHMRVIHQENSGWPGKPRNVGVDAARGEYVYFVDNDDWLGDQALERMYAFARENDSDVVIGKMAGKGRGVPRELFRRTYPKATLATAPLIDSLTPHKMFRKAFLDKNGLRFPEGRRRLEDHVFVTAAFFAAETISVLSDYVCYYHVRRDDSSNAGFQRMDPVGYFANLNEALDVVEANTEPGRLRDSLYRRWLRVEMVERLRGNKLLAAPDDYRRELFDQIANTCERFGPGVAAGLPPSQRVVAALIRARGLDDLVRLANWEAGISHHAELEDLAWHGGSLRMSLTSQLWAGREPMTFRHTGGRDVLDPPLSAEAAERVSAADLDATDRLTQSKVDIILRSRDNGAEHYLPVTFAADRHTVGASNSTFRLELRAEATLDADTAAGGAPLERGIWDVVARIGSCGWRKDTRLGSVRTARAGAHRVAAVAGTPPRVITPYWTDKGNLSVDVAQRTSSVGNDLLIPDASALGPATDDPSGGSELLLALPLRTVVATEIDVAAVQLLHEGSGVAVQVPGRLTPYVHDGIGCSRLSAQFSPDALSAGRWSVRVRLVAPEQGTFVPLPVTLTVPAGAGLPALNQFGRRSGDNTPFRDADDGAAQGLRPEVLAWLRTGGRLGRRAGKGLGRRAGRLVATRLRRARSGGR